jgi:hypothetical protein
VSRPTNQAPTANAGTDQTVNEGDNVKLDGSGSSDPDGTIASYSWTQTAGTYNIQSHFAGDSLYNAKDSTIRTLTVTVPSTPAATESSTTS